MKNNKRTFAVFASVLATLALANPLHPSQQQPAAVPTGKQPSLKNQQEKLSYALGAEVGNNLRKQSVEVDPAIFMQGLKDAFSGSKLLLGEAELHAILTELQAEVKRKQEVSEAEKVIAANRLAEKNKKEGAAFLAANKAKMGVITLESGLQYKVLRAGEGQKPTLDGQATCHFRGTLIDGTEFDSSHKRDKPVTFPLRKVIKGWSEALQLMPVGSKWQLFIPSQLAYGERGSPRIGIGPNSTLIFEVELISIQGKS